MVRFLRSIFYDFETREELDRFLHVERLVALLHIPASVCLAVGALAGASVIPYASRYKSHLLLAASLFLVLSNAREANECIRDVFLPERKQAKCTTIRKPQPSIGDHMHMFAALMMTLGSLSLFNSSLIALMEPGTNESVTSKRQYAIGFCLLLVGAAGNNLVTERALRVTRNTRVLLSFQNVICCASFGISGLLMVPSLSHEDGNLFHQSALTISVALGSLLAVLSAVMHYFYTVAIAWEHVDIFEKKSHEEKLLESGYVSQEQGETRHGYLRRLRDAIKTGCKSLIWREGIKENEGHDPGDKGQPRPGDAIESNMNPDLISRDECDDSSFSSTDTMSESSSWSGNEKATLLPNGRGAASK